MTKRIASLASLILLEKGGRKAALLSLDSAAENIFLFLSRIRTDLKRVF
jgi:hypothetical protein